MYGVFVGYFNCNLWDLGSLSLATRLLQIEYIEPLLEQTTIEPTYLFIDCVLFGLHVALPRRPTNKKMRVLSIYYQSKW